MRVTLYVIMVLAVVGAIYWLGTTNEPTTENPERDQVSPVTHRLVRSANAFTLDLHAELCAELRESPSARANESVANLMSSPFSAFAALHMAYAGARGQTAAEMAEVLHIAPDEPAQHRTMGLLLEDLSHSPFWGGSRLEIANRLWGQKGSRFLPAFLDTLARNYRSELVELDFRASPQRARAEINQWIEQQTNRRIVEALPAGAVNELQGLLRIAELGLVFGLFFFYHAKRCPQPVPIKLDRHTYSSNTAEDDL